MKTFLLIAIFSFVCLFQGEQGRAQTNLISIGHINDFSYGASDVSVSGHYAYLANGGDGLRIYDISDPRNPIHVGHTNNVGHAGNAMAVALFGDYAYIANSNDGMRIYDISDPAHPINVGHAPETEQPAASFGIAVSGTERKGILKSFWARLTGRHRAGAHFAFLANYNDGLLIYDVSDPSKPKLLSHVNDGGTALYVAVSGNYAFLANDYDGLRVYDFSNPSNPTNVAHFKDTGYPWGVAIAGRFAYIADNFYGFSIFDISDLKNIVSAGHINNSPPPEVFNGHNNDHPHYDGSAYGITVDGNRAYLANFGDGLRVYDISNPTKPVNIAHTETNYLGFSRKVAIARGYAFVANSNDGLRIYEIGEHPSKKTLIVLIGCIGVLVIVVLIAIFVWRRKHVKSPLT